MITYDLTTESGKQDFQRWVTELIRNEVNSVVRQVLFDRNRVNITTPNTSDTNPNTNLPYTAQEVIDYRLERLEQATYRR